MIRILQMIGSLNVGGSQTMILNIYRNIDREQMQFDFILDHPDETYFAGDVKALGGRIFTLPIFRGTNAGEVRRDALHRRGLQDASRRRAAGAKGRRVHNRQKCFH